MQLDETHQLLAASLDHLLRQNETVETNSQNKLKVF
jgi:hypothetical protein